ncbi:hemagglutinin repeat-containing protein, partial [Yersinia enterocolitica]
MDCLQVTGKASTKRHSDSVDLYDETLLGSQLRNTASASYGTGSDLQRAIQAATAITQGLTGGNIGQALAGGSAPYLAHEISKYLPADQSLGANLMAHAVLGTVVDHFSGNATVGAVSAFTAEAAAPAIIKAMGWDKDSLTEKQKQTVSALATLAAGLAGGLVGDSSSSAVAGAQTGKNAVENNSLSGDHGRESMKQAAESLKNQIRDKLGEGTTSSIANAIITALADTGDTALGGGDYALDYVMALASCATEDSYCTQALNDLAGKNQAAADKGTDGDIVVYGSQLQAGKGSESGNGVTHTETTVNAGNQLNITSGRDTVLKGSQVSGETVKADVGRDLLLQSQQDSDRYDSKQQDASIGGSFNFGSMTGSASINASHDKMHSNFDSVQEQTGIFAGKGGFDITVGEHTRLDGAVIASTATADKNTLDTGTLGFSNIGNKADFKVEHQSVGISTGGNIGGQFVGNMANGLLVGANNEGHDNSTTHGAVSDGTITLRDTEKQQQNVADLSRDVEHANNALSPIFDKEKEQNRLREAQLIGEIGSQVS